MWAHSANDRGERHDLVEHLRGTADRAAVFASAFGAAELARHSGLWHDLGKFHPDFQGYLSACEEAKARHAPAPARSVDHKGAGAALAARRSGPLAFLVAGHHGGLHDNADLRARLTEWAAEPRIALALQRAGEALNLEPPGPLEPPPWVSSSPHSREFFIRMLFSCLVDADFLDTEAHFQPEQAEARSAPPPIGRLWPVFRRHMEGITGHGRTEIDGLRDEVYRACLDAGEMAPGLFRLTVPTGGGKTLAGLGFALQHAMRHGHERVIVAVPYTTITEQTADVYRRVFHALPNSVLEHHSAMAPWNDAEAGEPGPDWQRLSAENWDAPLVVTTTVRLFETLFARRTSECRRLHRVAKSIVILDEAQTMPTHLLESLLDVLRDLTAHYGTSVVLCTATQPALDAAPGFSGLTDVREIAPDPPRLFRSLKRVRYSWPDDGEPRPWEWVVEQMKGSRQALAILNTKDDATGLLDACGAGTLHLSTSLCSEHRRAVLSEVRGRLARGEPCRLVSTQVVEAGVDISFPLVLRAFGPLDRIVQAAGRCNREGKLPERGRLVVFEPEGQHSPPGPYRTASDLARMMLRDREINPDDPATFLRYFRRLYQTVALDPHGIQALRAALRYKEVAEKAKVIEESGCMVLVPYQSDEDDHRAGRLAERTRLAPGLNRTLLRELQPFAVTVHARRAAELVRAGLMEVLHPGVYLWHSTYDSVRGLVADQIAPDAFII